MTHYNHTNLRMTAILAVLLVLGTMFSPAGHAQGRPHKVRVENASSFTITRLYLPYAIDVLTNGLGPDLLGNDILRPGDFVMLNVYNGAYALVLKDADRDVCVQLVEVDQSTTWRITNRWLLGCEWRTATN